METAVRRRAADALQQLLPSLTAEATQRLGHSGAVAFLARLETGLLDIFEPLDIVYGEPLLARFVRVALDAAAERPAELRDLDRRREIDRNWYLRARMVGYVAYADRFARTLAEIPDRL